MTGEGARPAVLVKQLEERDRRRMLKHFLALDDSDRLLRFGTVLPDEQVTAYVNKIDFARDTVYGVYNKVFKLVAVGHLAFAPKEQLTGGERGDGQGQGGRIRRVGVGARRAAWASAPSCSSAPPSIAATRTSTRCTCIACRRTRP